MRTKPDFEMAKKAAYKALSKHNINDFPIDMLKLLSSYKDLKVMTYSEMAKRRNCSIDDIIQSNASKDGVIHYHGKKDKYLILYNDTVEKKERIYWTLAHEFGHYFMNHLKETNKSNLVLTRGEFTDSELKVFEVEADFFARFFITPPPLIVQGNLYEYDRIMNFFGVSFEVASNSLNYILDSIKMGFTFHFPNFIRNSFNMFLHKIKFGKTCIRCNTFWYVKNSNFCPICGENNYQNIYKGIDIKMIYPTIVLDNEMRATKCPKCENEEVSNDYCKICGMYLFNVCTGLSLYESNSNNYELTRWNQHQQGCDGFLDGNARFCSACGSTSSFYEDGVLPSWQDEKAYIEVAAGNVDPDLPF